MLTCQPKSPARKDADVDDCIYGYKMERDADGHGYGMDWSHIELKFFAPKLKDFEVQWSVEYQPHGNSNVSLAATHVYRIWRRSATQCSALPIRNSNTSLVTRHHSQDIFKEFAAGHPGCQLWIYGYLPQRCPKISAEQMESASREKDSLRRRLRQSTSVNYDYNHYQTEQEQFELEENMP